MDRHREKERKAEDWRRNWATLRNNQSDNWHRPDKTIQKIEQNLQNLHNYKKQRRPTHPMKKDFIIGFIGSDNQKLRTKEKENVQEIIHSPTKSPFKYKTAYQQNKKYFSQSIRSLSTFHKIGFGTQATPNRTLKISDFAIGILLGHGRYGQVHLAIHKKSGFLCAIKSINKSTIKQQNLENQLLNQIKINLFLHHPNICSLYGCFSDAHKVYLIVEAAIDGNLYTKMKKIKKMQEEQAAKLIKQIVSALYHMHSRNILHRDIKPQNMVLNNDIVKLCDFGWSVICQDVRSTVCGTPLYLSPQLLSGCMYDSKTDIWAMGILAYELLLGTSPFKISSQGQLIRIISDEVPYPPTLSEQARQFLRLALQKDPAARQMAGDLLRTRFMLSVQS